MLAASGLFMQRELVSLSSPFYRKGTEVQRVKYTLPEVLGQLWFDAKAGAVPAARGPSKPLKELGV